MQMWVSKTLKKSYHTHRTITSEGKSAGHLWYSRWHRILDEVERLGTGDKSQAWTRTGSRWGAIFQVVVIACNTDAQPVPTSAPEQQIGHEPLCQQCHRRNGGRALRSPGLMMSSRPWGEEASGEDVISGWNWHVLPFFLLVNLHSTTPNGAITSICRIEVLRDCCGKVCQLNLWRCRIEGLTVGFSNAVQDSQDKKMLSCGRIASSNIEEIWS